MTTLYRTVPIESAEQAEALPVGTIAILDDDTLPVALHVTKTAEHLMPWRNGKHVGADENVVGAQALVPIEAEEVSVAMRGRLELDACGCVTLNHEASEPHIYRRTEYHTPWERAQ